MKPCTRYIQGSLALPMNLDVVVSIYSSKQVQKIMSVLLKSRESKVNGITDERDFEGTHQGWSNWKPSKIRV